MEKVTQTVEAIVIAWVLGNILIYIGDAAIKKTEQIMKARKESKQS